MRITGKTSAHIVLTVATVMTLAGTALAENFTYPQAAQIPDVTGKEVWVEGTMSHMARRNIEARGWTVKEHVGKQLGLK